MAQDEPCVRADSFRASIEIPPGGGEMFYEGEFIYLANSNAGLTIINVQNFYNPYIVGTFDTAGLSADVTLFDGYAAIADGPNGLVIADVIDPTLPEFASSLPLPGNTIFVSNQGSLIATANGAEGFMLVDASNPTDPTLLSNNLTPTGTIEVEIRGTILYVLCADRIISYDTSNPVHPVLLDEHLIENAITMDVQGDIVNYCSSSTGLGILDTSNPANLTSIETAWHGAREARDLRVTDRFVIQTRSSCVQETAYPTNSTLCYYFDSRAPNKLVFAQPYVFFTVGEEFRIIRMNLDEIEIGSTETNGSASDVDANEVVAAVANGAAGLATFDISDPNNPTQAGNYPASSSMRQVAVSGTTAFVTDIEGVKLIDISDISNPTLISTYETPDQAQDVVVDGKLAYITDRINGLFIVDWSSPTNLITIGTLDTPGRAAGITTRDGYAYIAAMAAGIHIVDISNPAVPTLLRSVNTPGIAQSVSLNNQFALVPEGPQDLAMINISDPANAFFAGSFSIRDLFDSSASDTISVAGFGDSIVVQENGRGVSLFDFADPTMPRYLGRIHNIYPTITSMKLIGERLFATTGSSGTMHIFDFRQDCEDNCPADLNSDNLLDFFDISSMIIAYQDQHPAADFNGDGSINFFDISEFIVRFDRGCSFGM